MNLKQGLLCAGMYLLSSVYHINANAVQPDNNLSNNTTAAASSDLDRYIATVYNSIDFAEGKISEEAFGKAMRGYLNLQAAGKLGAAQNILSIVDFTLSSNSKRLWIIDLAARKVLFHTLVAHGQGSGDEFATAFSDNNNSHQSSLGFYVTGDTYLGEHGTSLRLHGQDKGFNTSAFNRGVVVHGADYVSPAFCQGNQRLGRSWGCPAVASSLAPAIIKTIKNGSCLFIYARQDKYLASGYWLNKKVEQLPAPAGNPFIMPAPCADPTASAPQLAAQQEVAAPVAPNGGGQRVTGKL